MKTMKMLAALLVIALVLEGASGLMLSVACADVTGSKEAAPVHLSPCQPKTTVTLKFPSQERSNVDVVFVLDNSGSTSNAGISFDNAALAVLEDLVQRDFDIKVGIIKFNGSGVDAIVQQSGNSLSGLTEWNDANKTAIRNAMTQGVTVSNYGTNLLSGLYMAKGWLEADTDVDDRNKYLIIMTDGKLNMWSDKAGKIYSIYSQWYANGDSGWHSIQYPGTKLFGSLYYGAGPGTPDYNQLAGRNKYDYPQGTFNATYPRVVFENFMDLYHSKTPSC